MISDRSGCVHANIVLNCRLISTTEIAGITFHDRKEYLLQLH